MIDFQRFFKKEFRPWPPASLKKKLERNQTLKIYFHLSCTNVENTFPIVGKGVTTKFCLGVGRIHRHPKPTYPQNLVSPRISAALFWKCRKNAKIFIFIKKKILKYHNFWGDVPRWFFDCGGRVPVPPLSTPMIDRLGIYYCRFIMLTHI